MGTQIKKVDINAGMKKIIEENVLALASVNKKGEPHNIAVAFVKLVDKNKLLISNNYIEESIENIKNNPSVALVAWIEGWKENCIGYEFMGKAEYFTSGKWLEEIKKIPENKGAPCKGAIVVTINQVKVLD